MSSPDPFNIDRLIQQAKESGLQEQTMREQVREQFLPMYQRLAPAIWALCWREIAEDPENSARALAVINVALSATLELIVAMSLQPGTDETVKRVAATMPLLEQDRAIVRERFATAARGIGLLRIYEIAHTDTVTSIKALADEIEALRRL